MNENDLNDMEPLPWYRRRAPLLFGLGILLLGILAQALLQPA